MGLLVQDATSSNEGSSSSPHTTAHTIGAGSNRLLIVGVRIDPGNDNITGVTYNGVAMAAGPKRVHGNTGAATQRNITVALYSLINPPTGTANIVVSFSGGGSPYCVTRGVSYSNAHQTTQGTPTNTNAADGATTLASTLITTLNNALHIGMTSTKNQNMSAGANTTAIIAGGSNLYRSTNPVSPAGSNTITVTPSAADDVAIVSAAFYPIEEQMGSPMFFSTMGLTIG